MERKPLKRRKELVQLSKDHHLSLLFCWKIRQGVKKNISADRIKAYVKYFWQQHMQPHFLEEERFLFVLANDRKIEKALQEHTQITEQVQKILANHFEDELIQLMHLTDLVEAHVRYEERELFPHLELELSSTQLEHLAEQLDASPHLPDDFQDSFWVSEK